MNINSNQSIQLFPKCKICGAGIFLTEDAFVQHFSRNHSFPNEGDDEFDIHESQKSSNENKDTEVEQSNELSENLENQENIENEKLNEILKIGQDDHPHNDEFNIPESQKSNNETEGEQLNELSENESILENQETLANIIQNVSPRKVLEPINHNKDNELNQIKNLLSTITKRKCIVKIEKLNLKHYKLTCDKDLQCKICNKVFIQKGILAKHIEIVHEGIKKYTCQYCNSRFSYKANLARHIERMHEKNNKNYPCEFCGKLFAVKIDLSRHIQRVHGEKNYKVAIINYVCTVTYIYRLQVLKSITGSPI